jgi:hypothetical protein
MTISNSISIPRGLKAFMLKNCKDKVDFLGNSEVAFFYTPCRHAQGRRKQHEAAGAAIEKGHLLLSLNFFWGGHGALGGNAR